MSQTKTCSLQTWRRPWILNQQLRHLPVQQSGPRRRTKKKGCGPKDDSSDEDKLNSVLSKLNVDSDDSEEDESPAPVASKAKKNKGNKGKAASFAALDDSDEEEEEEEEEANKQTKDAVSALESTPPPLAPEEKSTTNGGGQEEDEELDETAELEKKKDAGTLTKEERKRLKELKKGENAEATKTKDGDENGLSKQEKKELKVLKSKKEDGELSKEEKRRYKELKSLKKGGGEDDERPASSAAPSPKAAWPPPKPQSVATAWPPPPSATQDGPEKAGEAETEAEKPAEPEKQSKPAKMNKLQMKMAAAKQKKAEAEAAKAAEEAKAAEAAKAEAPTASGDASGEAADLAPSTKPKPKAISLEDQQARVFNLGDDDGWKDASIPGSALGDGDDQDAEIPEIGADGKKITKKELKKLMKDREAKQRAKDFLEEQQKRSLEGAQFACSQTAIDERDPQWLNALDINIPSITISAYNKNLFVDAPLMIAHGRRYGLVGPNGKGKSTLLKMIASGALKIPPRIDALYVEQEVHADGTPAFEAVLMADKTRWALIKEERDITAQLASAPSEALDARLAQVYEEMTAIDAAAAEPKARRILYGLGFDSEMQNRPTQQFSGGWRMRISLARALFIEPTLLMLDEPTNHLDLNAVIWLDDYLQKWKKTLLIVSHDQDFLNSVCDEILHLNEARLDTYRGNYDTFKQLEIKKREQAVKAWELEQKRIKQLKSSGSTKAKANEQVLQKKSKEQGGSKKKRSEAIAAGTETAEAKTLMARPREYTVQLTFGEVQKLQPPIIQVIESSFRYAPNLPVILDEMSFGVDMDSRICIVGNNGSGKSTLLKLLIGDLEPTTGEVRRNNRLRVGVYNQHFVDKLPMNISPVEYLRNTFDKVDYQSARNLLGKFGLEGHAHEIAMRDLSGGQKARVTFCELTLSEPHVLFLDEPTNNLDIESIDALCDAINRYQGGMVVVTHDARLIEATESVLWVVEDRQVIAWDGEFDSYREHLLKKLEEQMQKFTGLGNK
mmetsp:Transcript_30071/g.67434  ORF Transcript_30071/g.67434 Transcript_30071/m.67434 type:complete len:1014 (-) Transcript_30071:33-3074(-)